ncbi:MAG: DegT/DnrJ/EryC1/StrS family aminotransferase [Cyanobium sp.]
MDKPIPETLKSRANFPLQDSRHYRAVIQASVEQVVQSGQTILADGVKSFEADFARWLGGGLTAEHCIGVGNGTDALELAMCCAGVEHGDGVIVPTLTAYATVAAILRVGARPIFADVESVRPVIAIADVERLLERRGEHPKIKAVIAVHLYGEACDLFALRELCSRHDVVLIEDCAQATGTFFEGSAVGTWGDFAAFSFYPTKNLAALGDGGMLVVGPNGRPTTRESARRLRFYGWDHNREAVQFGVNSRLDEIQAWILRGKLADLPQKIEARRKIALQYDQLLRPNAKQLGIGLPQEQPNWQHSYHLYVITVDSKQRNELLQKGLADGIPYSVHYSLACHQHPHLANQAEFSGLHLPNSERMSKTVLTLPLNPYLTEEDIIEVCHHLQTHLRGSEHRGTSQTL